MIDRNKGQTRDQRPSDMLTSVAVVVLSVCAVLLTGTLVWREFGPKSSLDQAERISTITEWRKFSGRGVAAGPADAPVTIVEFSDFQCPFCRAIQADLDSLRLTHGDAIRFIYRHFPIEGLHPWARKAALASECAHAQGTFRSMHDVLFDKQDSIGLKSWQSFAVDAGVSDLDRFERCLVGDEHRAAIERDVAAAHELGIRSTPTLLVNENLIRGRIPLRQLRQIVLAAKGASR